MIHSIVHISEVQRASDFALYAASRHKHWQCSRYALWQGLRQLAPELNLNLPDDLEIKDHHCLESNQKILVSLSHTEDYGAAVVGWHSEHLKGVGIDIEFENRPLPSGGEKFFTRKEDDETLKAQPLRLWVAKEAAFKAFSPLYRGDKTLVLKDFWIVENSFGIDQKRLGRLDFFPCKDQLCLAIASVEE